MEIINQLNTFMKNMLVDYAICGGHAIDIFVGKETRQHKDLDVAVFWDERNKIIDYMLKDKWDIYEPCGNDLFHKIIEINEQKRIKSNIWCVKPENKHYSFTKNKNKMYTVDFDNSVQIELDYIEFLFDTRRDGYFLYRRNQDIMLKIDDAILYKNNIPYLAPEFVLLYKSTSVGFESNQQDFENALIKINEKQLAWLYNVLKIMFPKGHEWLDNKK